MFPAVAARAAHRCEYCRAPQEILGYRLELEHIVPLGRGGESALRNLALACRGCNLFKGSQVEAEDPRTGRTVRLSNPRSDAWQNHFRWSRDRARIIGRTPTGRSTVNALRMNDEFRVIARIHWRRAGIKL